MKIKYHDKCTLPYKINLLYKYYQIMDNKQHNITRCQYKDCKKKLSLVQREKNCKCGKYFCDIHFFSKHHDCEYDYFGNNNHYDIQKISNKIHIDI